MFNSGPSLLSWGLSFLGSVTPSHQYIYPESAAHRTNQGPVLHGVDVEPTIHLWIHVGRIA